VNFSEEKAKNFELGLEFDDQALENIGSITMVDLFGGTSGILVIWYILQSMLTNEYLDVWACIALFSLMLRMLTYWSFNTHREVLSIKQWKLILNFMSLLGGTIWGSIILLAPDGTTYSLIMSGIIFAIIGGALGATGTSFSIFASFATPVSFFLTIHLVSSGEQLLQGLAFFTIVYLILTLSIAYKLTRSLKLESRLRLKNEKLLSALEIKIDEAEKANADKSRFLASASHDLRQPLHAMNLFADALKHQIKEVEQKTLLNKLCSSMDSMGNLLNSLLDISKLDAGLVQVNQVNFKLFPMLYDLEKRLRPQADEKSILLTIDSHIKKLDGITGYTSADNVIIQSDPVLLETILHNLLSNAIKYTQNGKITISCMYSEEGCILYIKDTGIGIDEGEKKKVFDAFYQINNANRDRSQGIGLGLSIVKHLCQLMGHPLNLSSKLGSGTTFEIKLTSANEASPPSKTISEHLNLNATVLVVDDEAAILDGMQAMLSHWGCQVLVAQSLNEVVDILKKHQSIDLALVDYRLQNQHKGTFVIREARKFLNKPDLPAIIISGDTEPKRMLEMEQEGFDILHKPIKPAQLRALMHYLLNCQKN